MLAVLNSLLLKECAYRPQDLGQVNRNLVMNMDLDCSKMLRNERQFSTRRLRTDCCRLPGSMGRRKDKMKYHLGDYDFGLTLSWYYRSLCCSHGCDSIAIRQGDAYVLKESTCHRNEVTHSAAHSAKPIHTKKPMQWELGNHWGAKWRPWGFHFSGTSMSL